MKEAWILNLLLWKLSDLRVKVLPQSHGLFLSSCISKFDPKALATLSKIANNLAIMSLVNHLSYPRNIMHMHKSHS